MFDALPPDPTPVTPPAATAAAPLAPVPSVRLDALGAGVVASLRRRFADQRRLAEVALAQVPDDAYFEAVGPLDPLAVQVKHMTGTLRSRFTDFLTTDGETPDRHRDREFVLDKADSREALTAQWDDGWAALDATLASLTPSDLESTVTVRDEPLGVVDALHRALAHAAYHTGQIVALSKHAVGDAWQTLSVPRGESELYTAEMRRRHAEAAEAPTERRGLW